MEHIVINVLLDQAVSVFCLPPVVRVSNCSLCVDRVMPLNDSSKGEISSLLLHLLLPGTTTAVV